ncbi:tyrosine-type recombinase/integrase [Laribacter hongkongensis]|uniref:tyrosine-type recombinase/integrase n=1 Tax=Laribacter hongkongensis TaxID=168471 RepID=UPI001EFE78D7|nr:integrase arm-type DNA-binding domain-containing protein [Laribacter hongkongensis]MCG9042139.1 tyrosine-type recombinase/integrase [Laribacter hongkongensis]MCG9066944.1 tyrosine-type recombinase/integrase [Laribacter hongkongensis]
MPLTALDCKNATPKADGKPAKHADTDGLYLLVSNSSKLWRFDYRFAGKRLTASFGAYPEVSLKEARQLHDEARRQLREGIDPMAAKKATKIAARIAASNSFESIAAEWLERMGHEWAPGHLSGVRTSLETYLFPSLGKRPITEIEPFELLEVLRQPEQAGKLDTAKRLRERASAIFKLAIATGRCRYNPAADLDKALKPAISRQRPSLPYQQAPDFLEEIEQSQRITRQTALLFKLMLFLGTRIGETVRTEWSHVDLEQRQWTIPPEIRKLRAKDKPLAQPHVIPLPTQAVEVFSELSRIATSERFVFPNRDDQNRHMSEATPLKAIERLGYDGKGSKPKITSHGFRATLSTALNEKGFNPDAIERQLSHVERNTVRAAYNRSRYLDERLKMLQWWSDWLTGEQSVIKKSRPMYELFREVTRHNHAFIIKN